MILELLFTLLVTGSLAGYIFSITGDLWIIPLNFLGWNVLVLVAIIKTLKRR